MPTQAHVLDSGSEAATPRTRSTRRRGSAAGDPWLVAAVVGLLAIGLMITYSASATVGDTVFGDGAYFLKRQLLWSVLGLVAAGVMIAIDYRLLQRYAVLIISGTLCLLLVLLAFGATRFGGQRWVLAGGSIQPSEVAKVAVIIYIAAWLASKGDDIRDVMLGLIPFAIITGLACGLVMLQPDFSTAILLGGVATAMFFVAGADLIQMLVSGTIATSVLTALLLRAPYRLARVRSFLDPTEDPSGTSYQVLQTLEAITRGGLSGVGLGQGQHKHILPAPHTDAVFAVLGEELGALGCLVVLGLFALLAWRGFRIAAGAPDPFASLLALGVTVWLMLQALINIAVVTAVVPFTGIPLPFLSFGGSSLVTCMAGVGLLLNIARHVDPKQAKLYAHLDLGRRDRRSRLSRAHRSRRSRRAG